MAAAADAAAAAAARPAPRSHHSPCAEGAACGFARASGGEDAAGVATFSAAMGVPAGDGGVPPERLGQPCR